MHLYILSLQDLMADSSETDWLNYITATPAHDINQHNLAKRTSAMIAILQAPEQHKGHRAYTIKLARKLMSRCERDGEGGLAAVIKNEIDKQTPTGKDKS